MLLAGSKWHDGDGTVLRPESAQKETIRAGHPAKDEDSQQRHDRAQSQNQGGCDEQITVQADRHRFHDAFEPYAEHQTK